MRAVGQRITISRFEIFLNSFKFDVTLIDDATRSGLVQLILFILFILLYLLHLAPFFFISGPDQTDNGELI